MSDWDEDSAEVPTTLHRRTDVGSSRATSRMRRRALSKELADAVRDRFGDRALELLPVPANNAHEHFTVLGPYCWLTHVISEVPTDDVTFYFFVNGAWCALRGVDGFRQALAEAQPATLEVLPTVNAYCRLTGARALWDRSDAEALLGPGWLTPAPLEAIDVWEPPRIENGVLRFVVDGGDWVEAVAVFDGTLAVDVTRRALSSKKHPLKGRVYRTDDGAAALAALMVAKMSTPATSAVLATQEIATLWRQTALAEHASVASFARAALELLAIAAPLPLVRRTHEAALDEIRHTEQSLAIASLLDGTTCEPGPLPALPPRASSFARVAVDTLVEAAVPETFGATVCAHAAAACKDSALAATVQAIAEDEARHAALAWDVVAYCVEVDEAARVAVREAWIEPPSLGATAPVSGYGMLTADETQRAHAHAAADVRLALVRVGGRWSDG